jgi:hypothetical protein
MTISAGFVTGETRSRRVVAAFVTRVAGDGTVLLAAVEKFRVVELRTLGGCGLEEKKYPRKGAKAQRTPQRRVTLVFAFFFAPLRLCVRNLHLMSLRFSGGRSAIR